MLKTLTYILLVCTLSALYALDIDVKVAKEKGGKYSILNLSSEEEFFCSQDKDYEKTLNSYTCVFKAAPKNTVQSMDTQFFYIFPSVKNGVFVLSIKPKRASRIFSYDADTLDSPKQQGVKTNARKFSIVSYEGEMFPFVRQKQGVGLNFPVDLESDQYPFVKSLDINGLPIIDNPALNDLKDYAEIKKMVEKGEYKPAITAINRIEKIFPNSIFMPEYELFRMKSMLATSNGGAVSDVIAKGKTWLRNYPTDEKSAEVLLIMANAFTRAQDLNNATYYYDRVINDYENLEISKQAMLDFGDAIKPAKPRTAADLYKRALFKTKDIKTASTAAFKLADTFLMQKDGANAAIYAEKIVNGNPDYLIKNKSKALEMAKNLSKLKANQSAYEIANVLLKNMAKNDEEYEETLSLIGEYAENAGDLNGAKNFYARFVDEFPKNKKANETQAKLDKLNFGAIEAKNDNAKIKDYEEVIKKYPADPIAKKALSKKAEILFAQNRCDELLNLKQDLLKLPPELATGSSAMIVKCEKSKAISQLKRGDCQEALIHIKANNVQLEAEYDPTLFECMVKTSQYENARDLAKKHLSETDSSKKLYWMAKAQKAYARLAEHKTVIELSRDILTLTKVLKQPQYNTVVFDMFASAVSTQNINAMVEAVKVVEQVYPNMPESLYVYKEMAKYGIRKGDNLTALNYSKKLFELQNKLKVFTDTPWLEFTYSDLLAKNGDTNGALLALASLRDKKLNQNDKARQLYNASVLWQKQGKKDTAKKLLTECNSLKEDSSWRKLCKDGLELY